MATNVKNGKVKNFRSNFFWLELIQNVLKRTLKRKTRGRKLIPVTEIFAWTLSFLEQKSINSEKWQNKEFWSKFFRSESAENVEKRI